MVTDFFPQLCETGQGTAHGVCQFPDLTRPGRNEFIECHYASPVSRGHERFRKGAHKQSSIVTFANYVVSVVRKMAPARPVTSLSIEDWPGALGTIRCWRRLKVCLRLLKGQHLMGLVDICSGSAVTTSFGTCLLPSKAYVKFQSTPKGPAGLTSPHIEMLATLGRRRPRILHGLVICNDGKRSGPLPTIFEGELLPPFTS